MSKYNQGILGPFSGKVGTVVGSFWKGRFVMRGRPTHMTNPNTPAQQTQRLRFSLVSENLAPLRAAVNAGFAVRADIENVTPVNVAMQVNMEQAVTGSGTTLSIDWTRWMVAGGQLLNVEAPTATAAASHKINMSWTNNSGVQADVLDNDSVCMVAYNPTKKQSVTDLVTACRDDQSGVLNVPALWVGDDVKVYIFARSEDKSRTSQSVLAGSVTILA